MFYSSIGNEVKTDFMIERSIKLRKKIVLPQTTKTQLIPRVIRYYPSDLSPGVFGILEPKEYTSIIDKNEIDIVIIPGIAFSKECVRLGYGKGYYDRFLANFKGKKIGIAFWEQIVDFIPKEDTDICLDEVITDKHIINCNKK